MLEFAQADSVSLHDVAKDKHYVCILNEDTQLACKPFWIYSDILGLNELVKRLTELSLDYEQFIFTRSN